MLIGKKLEELKVEKVEFYLDQPVSNSGRLKTRIIELLAPFNFKVQVFVINDVDKTLQEFYNVVSSDAIILDKCKSWINLNELIIKDLNCSNIVDLSKK
ncbi:MAG: hypothetical protein E7214_10620 [Clostridium sp.]|nr:hypothetical protein [Clostridium sp.]